MGVTGPPARVRFELGPGEIPADDPLPRRRLLGGPGIGGRIKERPEDFLVDEIPLYQPTGEGEHVYLLVQKRSMPHLELIDTLARQADYPEYQVRLRWEPHTVAFWDNRAVQHYAASDYHPQVRIMERASIVGPRPFR